MANTSLTFDIFAKDHASQTFDKVSRSSEGLRSKLGSLTKVAAGVATGLAGIGAAGFLKASIDEAREAAKVGRQTNAVLKSTGSIAGVTAKQVGAYATKLSNVAGIDDELIQSSENVLLTFTNVRNAAGKNNDIFNQGTKAALNMSAALGTDLQGATIQVGKALNDPIKGVTALQRVGVSFTKQQKDQIKTLVESGRTLDAQKLILKELNTEFGGAAAAAADPMQKLGVQFKNIEEQLGTALLPVITKLASFLADKLPGAIDAVGRAFTRVKKAVAPIISVIRDFVVVFRNAFQANDTFGLTGKDGLEGKAAVAGKAIRQLSDFIRAHMKPTLIALGIAVTALVSPFLLVIGAIAAAAAGAIYAYRHFKTFHDTLDQIAEVAKSVFTAFKAIVERVVVIVSDLWDRFGNTLIGKLKIAANAINDIISGLLQFLTGIFDLITAVMTGKWGKAWDALKDIVAGAWHAIGGMVRFGIDAVATVIEGAKAVISAAWGGIWHAFGTAVSDAFDKVGDVIKAIWEKVKPFVNPILEVIKAANDFLGGNSVKAPSHGAQNIGRGFGTRAMGGSVSAFQPYVVGELGPEMFVPRTSGTIVPNHALGAATPTIGELHVHTKDNPRWIGMTVNQALRDAAFLLGA